MLRSNSFTRESIRMELQGCSSATTVFRFPVTTSNRKWAILREPEVGNIGTGSRQCACENPQAFKRDPFDFRFRCFQLPVDEK